MTAAADSNKVAQSAAELGNIVLGQSDGAQALQRSAAEILAAAAAIGDSTFAQALLRRVVEAMAGTANPVRCQTALSGQLTCAQEPKTEHTWDRAL